MLLLDVKMEDVISVTIGGGGSLFVIIAMGVVGGFGCGWEGIDCYYHLLICCRPLNLVKLYTWPQNPQIAIFAFEHTWCDLG